MYSKKSMYCFKHMEDAGSFMMVNTASRINNAIGCLAYQPLMGMLLSEYDCSSRVSVVGIIGKRVCAG